MSRLIWLPGDPLEGPSDESAEGPRQVRVPPEAAPREAPAVVLTTASYREDPEARRREHGMYLYGMAKRGEVERLRTELAGASETVNDCLEATFGDRGIASRFDRNDEGVERAIRAISDAGIDFGPEGPVIHQSLSQACTRRFSKTVIALLDAGAPVDGRPGEPSPIVSALRVDLNLARELLERGADQGLGASKREPQLALAMALVVGDTERLRHLATRFPYAAAALSEREDVQANPMYVQALRSAMPNAEVTPDTRSASPIRSAPTEALETLLVELHLACAPPKPGRISTWLLTGPCVVTFDAEDDFQVEGRHRELVERALRIAGAHPPLSERREGETLELTVGDITYRRTAPVDDWAQLDLLEVAISEALVEASWRCLSVQPEDQTVTWLLLPREDAERLLAHPDVAVGDEAFERGGVRLVLSPPRSQRDLGDIERATSG